VAGSFWRFQQRGQLVSPIGLETIKVLLALPGSLILQGNVVLMLLLAAKGRGIIKRILSIRHRSAKSLLFSGNPGFTREVFDQGS